MKNKQGSQDILCNSVAILVSWTIMFYLFKPIQSIQMSQWQLINECWFQKTHFPKKGREKNAHLKLTGIWCITRCIKRKLVNRFISSFVKLSIEFFVTAISHKNEQIYFKGASARAFQFKNIYGCVEDIRCAYG